MIKADLHMHSKEDIVDIIDYTAYELIDRAAELGFGLLSITLHDHFPDYSEIEKYANKKNIIFFPGVEKVISGKEVLIYNLAKDDFDNLKTFEDLKKLREKNKDILTIAPHPYFKIGKCLEDDLEKNIDLFDAIEVSWFFSKHINMNKKAIEISKRYNKPLFANSDSHHLHHFGKNYTLIESNLNKSDLIDAIRKGKVILHAEPLSSVNLGFKAFQIIAGNQIKNFRNKLGLR